MINLKKMQAAILCGALIFTNAVPAAAEALVAEETVVQEAIAEEMPAEGESVAEEALVEKEATEGKESVEKEATEGKESVEKEATVGKESVGKETTVLNETLGTETINNKTLSAIENEPLIELLEAAGEIEPDEYVEINKEYETEIGESESYYLDLKNKDPYIVRFKNITNTSLNVAFDVYAEKEINVQIGNEVNETINDNTISKIITCPSDKYVDIVLTPAEQNAGYCCISYQLEKIKVCKEIVSTPGGRLYFSTESDEYADRNMVVRGIWAYYTQILEYTLVNNSGKKLQGYGWLTLEDEMTSDASISIDGKSYNQSVDQFSFEIPADGKLKIESKYAMYDLKLEIWNAEKKNDYDVVEENDNRIVTINYPYDCGYDLHLNNEVGKVTVVNGGDVPACYSFLAGALIGDGSSAVKIDGLPLTMGEDEQFYEKDFVLEPEERVVIEYDERVFNIVLHTKHSVKVVEKTPATCMHTGLAEYRCREYGCEDLVLGNKILPVIEHKSTVSPAVSPTCTSAGKNAGSHCYICGTVLKAQTTVPAKGHSFGAWTVTKQPTALANGVQTRTCSACGEKQEQSIAKLAATGSLNMTVVPLKVKQSTTLKVAGMAAGDAVASYVSSDTKIATVNGSGKITAKKKGTATVTVTLKSGKVLKATVKVQTGNVKTTKVAANITNLSLDLKKTFQLKTVVTPLTSLEKVTYKSSNTKIVTVSKTGKLTAKKPGKATITVKSGSKKCYVKVTVNNIKTTGITVNSTQVNLKVKKSFTLKAKLIPGNSTEAITYKTSNKKVATVSSKGKITAKKAGTATITVQSGSKSVKVQVAVTK